MQVARIEKRLVLSVDALLPSEWERELLQRVEQGTGGRA